MVGPETAQAAELVRALCDKVQEMSSRLARLEQPDVHRNASREKAELRYDISQAQVLVERLQRKYFTGDNDHARSRAAGNLSHIARREMASAHRRGAF